MKKLMIIVAAGIALVLCNSELWARGGHGGGGHGGGGGPRGGSHAGSSHRGGSNHKATGKSHHTTSRTRVATHNSHAHRHPHTHTHMHHPHIRIRIGGYVPGTTRIASACDSCEPSGPCEDPEADDAEPTFGMQIRELMNGTARKQGMMVGDIIMAINGTPTPDLDSFRSALQQNGSRAEVDFINVENGQLERITLNPTGGAIGASVVQVQVD